VSFGRKQWFLSRFINWQTFTLDLPEESRASVDESVAQIEKLVSDPEHVRRMRERMHYVWPLLTMASSRTRAAADGVLLDTMGLFYAELANWLPDE